MKRADNRTDYVLVKARTNSEWDSISFAVFQVTDEWLQSLQARMNKLQPFTDDFNFWEHIYFGSPEGFYETPDDWDLDEILNEGEVWTFVETNGEELEQLPVPENRLDTHLLVLDRYGNVQFKAYGKHTGEEFYTDGLDAKAFLNRCNHDAGLTGRIETFKEQLSAFEQGIVNAVTHELQRIGRPVSMDEFPYVPFSETVQDYVESIRLDENGLPILECSFRDVHEKYLSAFISGNVIDHWDMIALAEHLGTIKTQQHDTF